MSSIGLEPAADWAEQWHQRARAETLAALDCDDPRIAALHVELATRCLQMARCDRLEELGKAQPL